MTDGDGPIRAVFEGAADGLLLLSDDGVCVDANPAACSLLGVERDALRGQPLTVAVDADPTAKTGVWEVDSDGEPRRLLYEETTETTDGARLVSVRPLPAVNGRLFARLFESIPVGVALYDSEGRFLRINRRAETLLGYSLEEVVGTDQADPRYVMTGVDGDDLPADARPFARVRESGRTIYEQELTFGRPDGTEVLLSVSSAPIHNEEGEVTHVVSTFNDISLRTEYETLLQHQNERLDEFASIISHDLRSPIAVASGWLEVARQDDDLAALDKVEGALERMERLVTDVLALARQGKTVDAPEPVDLRTAVEEAWANTEAPDATLDLEGDLGVVLADEIRLGQLFENLFRNSLEHVGADVTVSVGLLDDGGFYVADDGPGIPEEKRERVMEYGFTTSKTGTGFGLAIIEAIAVAHGWTVTLTEREGGGARFEFVV
jgi:PAS domain S-box-containing protein